LLRVETKRKSRKLRERRVRHGIYVDILETAKDGTRKTHLMYNVGLSFAQTKYYLNHLLSKNFIKKEGKFYRTTEKGLKVIEACKTCLELTE